MINVNVIGEMISVSYKDQTWNTLYTKEKYGKLNKIEEKSEEITSLDQLNKLLEKVEKICSNDYKEKIETEYKDLYVNEVSGKHYLKINDKIVDIAIPEVLVDRIKKSLDKDIDISPIIKAWTRFLRNPALHNKIRMGTADLFVQRFAEYINMTYVMPNKVNELMEEQGLSLEVATELARTYEVKITKEGLIECYKTSNEELMKYAQDENGEVIKVERHPKKTVFNEDTGLFDLAEEQDDVLLSERVFKPYMMGDSGDAFWCEGPKGKKLGHLIRVGHTHYLDSWNQVDCDDNRSCVKGLHLGGLSYIASWNADIIHSCFVDPMHIGAICNYSSDNAIRVKQYYVNGSLTEINDSIYHSSTYANQTEDEWDSYKEEILEELGSNHLFEEVAELDKKKKEELSGIISNL